MPNTLSDPYLQLAFWVGVASLTLTLAMVGVIVWLRFRLNRATRREAAFLAVWRPALMEALGSSQPSHPLPVLYPADRLFFLKLWNYLHESLRGAASVSLNQIARRLDAQHVATHLLKHGNRAERLLGTLTLGQLRERAAWDVLFAQAAADDSLLSIHAARALIQIDPTRGAQHLMPLLIKRDDWDINRLASMLGDARADFSALLSRKIVRVEAANVSRVMRLAEALKLSLPLDIMAYLLDGSRPVEMAMAGLRLALDRALLPLVRSHLNHADWRVRVQAVKSLGRIGEADDAALLTAALQDREWWVRYRAAQALADSPFVSAEQLQALRLHTPDRFAQDMLGQVFAERAIA